MCLSCLIEYTYVFNRNSCPFCRATNGFPPDYFAELEEETLVSPQVNALVQAAKTKRESELATRELTNRRMESIFRSLMVSFGERETILPSNGGILSVRIATGEDGNPTFVFGILPPNIAADFDLDDSDEQEESE